MRTHRRIAAAPISWGICEVPGWGRMLDAERVLGEMAALGISATELGAPGFLPADPAELLDRHGLQLVGSFLPVVAHEPDASAAAAAVRETAATLGALGADVLSLALVRDMAWSEPGELTDAEWSRLGATVAALDELAAEHGVTVALHPHEGTLVETADQVRRALSEVRCGWCLDTGHLFLGGFDPAEFAAEHADRVVHVHLKDVDAAVAARLRTGELSLLQAVQAGVFTALGTGGRGRGPCRRRARPGGLRALVGARAGHRDHRAGAGGGKRTDGGRTTKPRVHREPGSDRGGCCIVIRISKGLAVLVFAAPALFVAACGDSTPDTGNTSTKTTTSSSGSNDADLTIAMVTHSDEGSFWSVVKKGAEAAAKSEGVKLIWSPSNNDPQKEAQLIGAAVSQKVDGLAVSVPNPDAIKGALEQAKAANIPIITLNSGADVSKALGAITHVGQDEVVAGRAAGERLKSRAPRRCCASSTSRTTSASRSAATGVKEGFGPAVTDLQVKGTANIATTQTEIKSKLQADKSFDAVMALNPDIAEAAKTAIKGASSSAKLATFDQSGPVIKDIEAGTIEFAVDQQQYLQGYLPIVFLKLFKTNANTVGGGQAVLTGPGFVDKDNAATIEQLAQDGTR